VVAGVGKMGYKRFATFNVIGGAGWIFSMSFLGYFASEVLGPQQIEHLVYFVVFVSILPLVIGFIRARTGAKKNRQPGAEGASL